MGFLGDPKEDATLADLEAMLGGTALLDRQTGGVLHQTTGLGAEAIICQFGNHFAATNLAARGRFKQVADIFLALQVPNFTRMGGFTHQFAILKGQARGDNLHLTGVTCGFAQAHGTTVFTHKPAFSKHIPGMHRHGAIDNRLGIGRQVIHIATEDPETPQSLGLEGDVALAVSHFPRLNHILVADLAGQIADHILGGLFNALLDSSACRDLGQNQIGRDQGAIVDKQNRTGGDLQPL